jgi:hypothetical protein
MLKNPPPPSEGKAPDDDGGIHARMNTRADFLNAEFGAYLSSHDAGSEDAADLSRKASDDEDETEGRHQGGPRAGRPGSPGTG